MSKPVRALFELVRMHRIFDIYAYQRRSHPRLSILKANEPIRRCRLLSGSVAALQESILRHAKYSLGKEWADLSGQDRFAAVALAVRDRLMDRMLETEERYRQNDSKRLYYLSIEFLIGTIAR